MSTTPTSTTHDENEALRGVRSQAATSVADAIDGWVYALDELSADMLEAVLGVGREVLALKRSKIPGITEPEWRRSELATEVLGPPVERD